jgi:hypothetical protein
MIWRLAASAAAAAPIAAEGVLKASPVHWTVLGYQFEAAGMIAALFGCAVARVWHGSAQAARQKFRWQLDAPISAMTLGTTVALVMKMSPEPWWGLLYGTGLGVIGEGIFKLAERFMRASGLFGEGGEPTGG